MKLFVPYLLLGTALGWVSAALMQAVAAGHSFQAAALDMVLTGAGMLACDALINRRFWAVLAYILGGGFGTWLVT